VSDPRPHWDEVYRSKPFKEVSWYQPHPTRSLELIRGAAPDPATAIVDVGCGAAVLIGELASVEYSDLTGVDVSAVVIAGAQARFADQAQRIEWIVADATTWTPARTYDVWHDRAVFHFLIDRDAQEGYLHALRRALRPGRTAIIATFALDGPERCSGLPVQRYSGTTLAERLGSDFRLVSEVAETHTTPKGAIQKFTYSVFNRC
jgi:SAM-dependent methyltransferase